MGSLQRRIRACLFGVRAQMPAPGAPELTDVELYLAWRAQRLAARSAGRAAMSARTWRSPLAAMLACIALAAGCASDPLPSATDAPAASAGLAGAHDLRGAYRAALCARDDMSDDECARVLYRFAGEVPAPRPPAADPSRYRLLFVPGFLASCFPHIHSFADVVAAAEQRGFAAEVLAVGGRNNVAANARIVAAYIERMPDDGRRIIIIGHSKGAVDALEAIATSPQAAARVAAVLTVGGSLQGSAVADRLYGTYHSTLALIPFPTCDRGEGDPVEDMQPATRQRWWTKYGAQLTVPIYSIVGVPQLDRVSPLLLPSSRACRAGRATTTACCSRATRSRRPGACSASSMPTT